MSIDEQLRALGDHLDEVQEPITADQARHRARADISALRSPSRHRLLLIAAVIGFILAGVVGLVALESRDEDPLQPVDTAVAPVPDPTVSAPSATTSPPATDVTQDPSPTTVAEQPDSAWSGGLLDDLDTDSLRPLVSYTEGDAIIPTAPSGWRVQDSTLTSPDDAMGPDFVEWTVDVVEAPPDEQPGYILYLSLSREPRCVTTLGCQPSGESITIDGVVWESVVVERIPDDDPEFFDETTLRAQVGDRWIWVGSGAPQALNGRPLLENPQIIEFLEGLRVGPPDVLRAIGEGCRDCDGAGAEGDPFAARGSDGPRTTTPDGESAATSEPPTQASDNGELSGRPLSELVEGDVVVATYIPAGFTSDGGATLRELPGGLSVFEFNLASADEASSVRVTLGYRSGASWTHSPAELDDLNHPPVEIQGLVWGWNDFAVARIAYVDSFSIDLGLHGLDRSEAERFIEGLRAIPFEQFTGSIAVDGADGLRVIDPTNAIGAQIVATEDEFRFTAVRASDQVCTKLEQTTDPVTMGFAANCWDPERFADSGVVDFVPLDATDTEHLIIGVVDSPSATAVRLTSPDGVSVVVPTGPVNDAIDGRFFLARLDLDNSIDPDLFAIEEVSA